MKRKTTAKTKKIVLPLMVLILSISGTSLFALEDKGAKQGKPDLLPLLVYDFLEMGSLNIHSPGAGLIVAGEDVMAVGLYTAHSITGAPTDDYPSLCHSLEFLLDGGKGRHRYLGFFKSESDEPVYGGLNTFQTAGVYGYELVQGPRLSLVLGAGLAVGDFGIELEDGTAWPIIPVPLLRMNYSSEWVDASFDFLTGPNLTVTLAPEKQVRFTGDFRMDEYPDLIYETLLHYRFFPADHPMGDIAGISVGFKNDVYGFDLAGEEEALEIQYRALFATIDLTLLKITGGYSFKEWNKESGMYVSLQGMYQF